MVAASSTYGCSLQHLWLQVRQSVGVIASLFTWVSAAAVLGGSPSALLPNEVYLSVTQCNYLPLLPTTRNLLLAACYLLLSACHLLPNHALGARQGLSLTRRNNILPTSY